MGMCVVHRYIYCSSLLFFAFTYTCEMIFAFTFSPEDTSASMYISFVFQELLNSSFMNAHFLLIHFTIFLQWYLTFRVNTLDTLDFSMFCFLEHIHVYFNGSDSRIGVYDLSSNKRIFFAHFCFCLTFDFNLLLTDDSIKLLMIQLSLCVQTNSQVR